MRGDVVGARSGAVNPRAQALLAATLPTQRSVGGGLIPSRESTAPPILIAEPDASTAGPLADQLGVWARGPITVVGSLDDADAVAAAEIVGVLAIIGLRFGPRAIDLIGRLRTVGWSRVLAWTSAGETTMMIDAMQAGATGIIINQRGPGAAVLLPSTVFDLSGREIEVIAMVADGRSNKWIGQHLDLSALTVKSHLARIGRKLGTGDRAHIVTLALQAGIIS